MTPALKSLLLAALLAAVGARAQCASQAWLQTRWAALSTALETGQSPISGVSYAASGTYTPVQGQFGFFNFSNCASGAETCLFQNGGNPYGFITLPHNPKEAALARALYQPPQLVTGASWRLDTAEAVILAGCTPPTGTYIGFTPYVNWHYQPGINTIPASLPAQLTTAALTAALAAKGITNPAQVAALVQQTQLDYARWINTFGSVADTLNQASLQTFAVSPATGATTAPDPAGVFDSNMVLILTGSQATYDALLPIVADVYQIPATSVNLLQVAAPRRRPAADTRARLPPVPVRRQHLGRLRAEPARQPHGQRQHHGPRPGQLRRHLRLHLPLRLPRRPRRVRRLGGPVAVQRAPRGLCHDAAGARALSVPDAQAAHVVHRRDRAPGRL
jgi:hypothetical protein